MTRFVVLTSDEAESTAEAIETLRPLPWARPLLDRVEHGGWPDYRKHVRAVRRRASDAHCTIAELRQSTNMRPGLANQRRSGGVAFGLDACISLIARLDCLTGVLRSFAASI